MEKHRFLLSLTVAYLIVRFEVSSLIVVPEPIP